MLNINSRDNPRFRLACRLVKQPRLLKKQGLAVAEGLHLLQDLVGWPGLQINQVWLGESMLLHTEWAGLCGQLLDRPDKPELYVIPDMLYWQLSELNSGAGPLTVFELPGPQSMPASACDVLLIDGVQDPGNLGTLIRTAAAAGLHEVWTTPGTAWVWQAKVLRAGMGGHRWVNFRGYTPELLPVWLDECLSICTDLDAVESLFDVDLTHPTLWMVGSEGEGVSPAWKAQASHRVHIPHQAAVDSLNVAVATGVCLFEQLRQRRAKG
jgi:TrmH family RNA methyltransferase